MSNAMEASKDRLKQLEDIERRLYLKKEAITQRRAREDEQLQLKRQEEDHAFLETLRERDQEEDELRRKRRILSRSSFGPLTAESGDPGSRDSSDFDNGPLTRSKTKAKRSASKAVPSSSSGRRDSGPPTARDRQGRELFTRSSDGKLVYLHCCVPGCGRTDFPNARALRSHLCSPVGLPKILGLITSNFHAIEVCGQVAPGQDALSTTARDQPFGPAPVANMTPSGILPSPPTGSDEHDSQSKASSRSTSDAEAKSGVTLNNTLESFKVQDLGRVYRTKSSNHGGQKKSRTRAEEAAEVFHGFTSSDSEDSDESDDGPLPHRKIPADRIDQHKAANSAPRLSTCLRAGLVSGRKRAKIAGGDSALVVLAVDDQAVKKERSTSPPLFPQHSECHPSPETLIFAPEAEHVGNFETEANHSKPNLGGGESIATRKRASSAPPVTPPAINKRLRLTDENLERLVRSCSRVAMGRE